MNVRGEIGPAPSRAPEVLNSVAHSMGDGTPIPTLSAVWSQL